MTTTARDIAALVNKALGADVLGIASDAPPTSVIPTGVLPFDLLLGGGLPRGRMTEVFGAPSSLKSYLGLCAIREAQHLGGTAALIDTEHTFDPGWARSIGVANESLLLQHPSSGELALDTAEALVSGKIDLLVIDSVAATLPEAERNQRLAGEKGQPGRLANLMSKGLRKVTTANSDTAILWINQLREQIGVTFGNPEKPTGGRALPFYASIRINIKQAGKLTVPRKVHDGEGWVDGRTQTGQKWRAVTEKNKLDRPHQEVYFTWLFNQARVDETGFLFAQGIETGVITQRGSMWDWQAGDETGKVRGKEALRVEITGNRKLREAIVAASSVSHGHHVPLRSGGTDVSGTSSADTGTPPGDDPGSTRARAPGRSRSTAVRKKRSSR